MTEQENNCNRCHRRLYIFEHCFHNKLCHHCLADDRERADILRNSKGSSLRIKQLQMRDDLAKAGFWE